MSYTTSTVAIDTSGRTVLNTGQTAIYPTSPGGAGGGGTSGGMLSADGTWATATSGHTITVGPSGHSISLGQLLNREGQECVVRIADGVEIVHKVAAPSIRLKDSSGNVIELGWRDGVFQVLAGDAHVHESAKAFIGSVIAQANRIIR